MEHQTSKAKIYASLITPSASGWIVYIFLAAMSIILNQFEMIKAWLQIPHDLRFFRVVTGWLDSLLTNTIGQSTTETLVVGAFWAVVGLAVYLFLRGLVRLAVELDDDLGVRGFVWPKGTDRYRPLRELAEQLVFRLVALVALSWLIFEPLAAVLRGPVFVDFLGPNKIVQFAVWFVSSVLLWHMAVILARLVAMKARLFG